VLDSWNHQERMCSGTRTKICAAISLVQFLKGIIHKHTLMYSSNSPVYFQYTLRAVFFVNQAIAIITDSSYRCLAWISIQRSMYVVHLGYVLTELSLSFPWNLGFDMNSFYSVKASCKFVVVGFCVCISQDANYIYCNHMVSPVGGAT